MENESLYEYTALNAFFLCTIILGIWGYPEQLSYNLGHKVAKLFQYMFTEIFRNPPGTKAVS